MKVMVILKASAQSEAMEMPDATYMGEMIAFHEELVQAGILKVCEALKPSSAGVRVHFGDTERTVHDGPFAETKELIAGYWLFEVDSMETAIAWVKRFPKSTPVGTELEVRPFYEAEDCAAADIDGSIGPRVAAMERQVATEKAQIEAYLFFGGRCEEALTFYQAALGAKLEMVLRFNQSPDPVPAGMLQAGFEDKIMHASMLIGKTRIMASDGCNERSGFEGFRLTLSVDDPDHAHVAFQALAEGGKVDMPLAKTFWSPCYGMVTDRFGVGWMVMVPGEAAHQQA